MKKAALLMLLSIDLIWLRSGFDKLTGGKFLGGIAQTLKTFAGKNPYPWYKNFLETVAIPNSQLFGLLSMWGEVLVALGLLVSLFLLLFDKRSNQMAAGLLIISLIGGLFLNITFWLAAGWTSSSTGSLNLLMALIEGVGLFYALKLLAASK